ncbi:hypothetical protein ACLOJK_010417 [Asimina triloba]
MGVKLKKSFHPGASYLVWGGTQERSGRKAIRSDNEGIFNFRRAVLSTNVERARPRITEESRNKGVSRHGLCTAVLLLRVMAKGTAVAVCVCHSLLLSLFLSSLPSPAPALKPSNIESTQNHSSHLTAIYVFGDSTVDPGNNNYVQTIFRSDFPPYGRDFTEHTPTGRFTNGRLLTDFAASLVGLKDAIPAYLDKTLRVEELLTGVSFASAGSGYDPLTPKIGGVIDLPTQLNYFGECKKKLELLLGKEKAQDHIQRSAVIVSAGTNDFVVNYFGVPLRRKQYTVEQYQLFVLQNFREFIQGLWELGHRRIAVAGLPPFGCLPIVITGDSGKERKCKESYNAVAKDYNVKLQAEIQEMQNKYRNEGGRVVYGDIYGPIADMAYFPDKYGFVDSTDGCCGTGLFEVSIFCTPRTEVCTDASKFVFFDSIHPTEKAYYVIFQAVRNLINSLTISSPH